MPNEQRWRGRCRRIADDARTQVYLPAKAGGDDVPRGTTRRRGPCCNSSWHGTGMFHVEPSGDHLLALKPTNALLTAQISQAVGGQHRRRPAQRIIIRRLADHQEAAGPQQHTGPLGGDGRRSETPGRHGVERSACTRSQRSHVVGDHRNSIVQLQRTDGTRQQVRTRVAAFDQGDLQQGSTPGDHQAGQAAARAEVGHRANRRGECHHELISMSDRKFEGCLTNGTTSLDARECRQQRRVGRRCWLHRRTVWVSHSPGR
jgi:hypothetical protein